MRKWWKIFDWKGNVTYSNASADPHEQSLFLSTDFLLGHDNASKFK